MEPHALLFPSFTAPLSDLYGASNYRVAEAHAYARDLDDLDREELALEHTVRALVDRKAPPPIGLNFHRAQTTGASVAGGSAGSVAGHAASRLMRGAPVGLEAGSRPSGARGGYHGHVAADDVEEDDDDDDEEEEEEMEEEDDMEELEEDGEEEEEDDGTHTAEDDDELFPEDDEEDDELEEDDEERAQSDSMDMSM